MTKASKPSSPVFVPNPKARLFDQVREVLRFHHYALRTEEAYLQWIKRYLVFHRDRKSTQHPGPLLVPGGEGGGGWRHPKEMGAAEVREVLTHLAAKRDVAAATQH